MDDREQIYVKPAEGLKVRDERTALHIPEGGDWLPISTYVRRRLRCGDLVKATPPKPAKAIAAAKSEEN